MFFMWSYHRIKGPSTLTFDRSPSVIQVIIYLTWLNCFISYFLVIELLNQDFFVRDSSEGGGMKKILECSQCNKTFKTKSAFMGECYSVFMQHYQSLIILKYSWYSRVLYKFGVSLIKVYIMGYFTIMLGCIHVSLQLMKFCTPVHALTSVSSVTEPSLSRQTWFDIERSTLERRDTNVTTVIKPSLRKNVLFFISSGIIQMIQETMTSLSFPSWCILVRIFWS